ncbi:hypothetical protein HPB51_009876 [Rhipicephalus microplus]|uniref:SCP domain-containing protein n=1 Tax=Rhipicephalus microplus TaxID=6941 RepID=A0A9J6ESC9_RHIMP|nr:hypothetical protein HPB51_009876 [Rhipicephalus microplus]
MNLLAFLAIVVSCSTVLTYARRHFEKTQPTGNPNGVGGDGGEGGGAPAAEEPDDFEGQFTPSMRKFQRQVLRVTNQFRRRHGVPILKQDARMNRYAQSWALVLALKDELQLRTKPKYGENTYKWWSTDMKAPITGKVPVTDWYNEIKKYNFSDPGFRSDIGHFTQLVWRGSRRLGTGIARSRKGNYYIVCEYEPRGNILGQFGHQVRRRLRRGGAGSDEEGGEGSEEGGRKRRRRRRRKHDDEEEDDD